MERNQESELDITVMGNPRKPRGMEGAKMLERMNSSHAAVTEWAFSFLDVGSEDRILDVGCGGGAALARLSARTEHGHLTGVDYSPVSVQASREYNRRDVESGKMEILEGSVDHLPFADEQFDKIVTVESFYFWPHPVEDLREVRRVLSKTGSFLLTADIYQKDDLCEEARENIRKFALFNPTAEEYVSMFRKAGFGTVTVRTKEGTDWICIEGRR